MFSDISFREKLLDPRTQDDFKQELVTQRHLLSEVKANPIVEEVEESDPRRGKPLEVGMKHEPVIALQ